MRLGRYEVLSALGKGGMGDVFVARDMRLDRLVAIKVVSTDLLGDAAWLHRFEQEARAAGMLNHPNILAIYDIGTHDPAATTGDRPEAGPGGAFPYIVSELLEGKTLREHLSRGPLPIRTAVDYALQMAQGLAAAHAKGIVHRDLKPENLFVTRDGRLKILDFGLAKLHAAEQPEGAGPTGVTATGVVMGTAGYMSPEQVRGETADKRSDLFSFGAILYEMLTGSRAFSHPSAVETMHAILASEPEAAPRLNHQVAPALDSIVRRCLAKDPERRFQSAADLAFALEVLTEPGAAASTAAPARPAARTARRAWSLAIGAALIVGLAAFAVFTARRRGVAPLPSFKQLTFRNGTIWSAKFAPDGKTIVYAAAWEGQPVELFSTRPESPESRPLGIVGANILSISTTGEMAVSLNYRPGLFAGRGTLAQVPLSGGAPRELLENVQEADWAPNGRDLAVISYTRDGRCRLEFPIGTVLYEPLSPAWLSHVRVSPGGRQVAFLEHPLPQDDRGAVAFVDLTGKKTVLGSWNSVLGLTWSTDGDEILFTAGTMLSNETPQATGNNGLHAVTLSGGQRSLYRMAGRLILQDRTPDGRFLLLREHARGGVIDLAPGETKERDLSWFDAAFLAGLSDDGRTVLMGEGGEGGGVVSGAVYLRHVDGSPAVRLGDGYPISLSPDGRWALARLRHLAPPRFALLPIGPGRMRLLPQTQIAFREQGGWFPDSTRMLLTGAEPGHQPRSYAVDIESGEARPVTPEGVTGRWVSPDGRYLIAGGAGRKRALLPVDGSGSPRPIPGLEDRDVPIRFSADGHSLFASQAGERFTTRVYRIDLASGRRDVWNEIAPSNVAGLLFVRPPYLSADGKAYAYDYFRYLHDLFLMEP